MSTDSDKYWRAVFNQLRCDGKLMPLSVEDAEKEYLNAPSIPISVEEREDIVQRIVGRKGGCKAFPSPMPVGQHPSFHKVGPSTCGEFAQLNRNKGSDAAAEAKLNQMREELLGEDELESNEGRLESSSEAQAPCKKQS